MQQAWLLAAPALVQPPPTWLPSMAAVQELALTMVLAPDAAAAAWQQRPV